MGDVSPEAVEFQLAFRKRGLGEWQLLDDIMGDQKECGALYCKAGIRHARIAQQYMTILALAKPVKSGGVGWGW